MSETITKFKSYTAFLGRLKYPKELVPEIVTIVKNNL